MDWLTQRISTFDFSIEEETSDDKDLDHSYLEDEDDSFQSINVLTQFVDELNNEAKKIDVINTLYSSPNPYYCLELVDSLRKIFVRYTTWSNVMQVHYGSPDDAATSACSQSYFNILKKELQ